MDNTERIQNEINHMQVRLFRLAWEKWKISRDRCADLFEQYNVDDYINASYEFFHIQGDNANLEELKEYLCSKGAKI